MPTVEVEGTRFAAPAIDLRPYDVSPAAIRSAVCAEPPDEISVQAPPPGPVYDYVGTLVPGRSYGIQAALAAAARARGLRSSYADELQRLQTEIDELAVDPETTEATEAKRTVAETETESISERLDTLRGRIQEQRRNGQAEQAVLEEFRELAATLSERKLEATAARQRYERRSAERDLLRDQLETRLKLQDRYHNLERTARRELAERLEPQFQRAVAAVPGSCQLTDRPGVVQGDDTTAALAVARIAPIQAPLIVACDRFPTAVAARAALAAPVIVTQTP